MSSNSRSQKQYKIQNQHYTDFSPTVHGGRQAVYLLIYSAERLNKGVFIIKEMATNDKIKYSREQVKNWIQYGIANGFINQYKKDQIIKWVDLLMKNGVVYSEIFRPK